MKPFLKWVGGKSKIIDEVKARIPKRIETYYEPFIGGGSVLLSLLADDSFEIKHYVVSDANSRLINTYLRLQSNPEELIKHLTKLRQQYVSIAKINGPRKPSTEEEALESRETFFYWIRKKFNEKEDLDFEAAAMFIFLNKTCWRGVYREGPNGFNVPYGNYKSPMMFDESELRKISELIQNVTFTCQSFEVIGEQVTANDFVYLDPPYIPENSKSFTQYLKKDFTCHDELLRLCKFFQEKDIKFLMSNSCTDKTKETFGDFELETIVVPRRINSKNPGSTANELFIS